MAYQYPLRSQYGPCDSFFVESDDDGIFAMRTEQRERARIMAKYRQKELGLELSRLTADEYQNDIIDHMEHMESETMPDVNSIDIQTEVQWYMRPYLLDFLIEAHTAFQLLPDTLFLSINLLDRYCSKRVVYKKHYQLVGCAALLIAAKYGDRKDRVPTVRELKSMCCSLYDDEMFTQMEWHVLQTLNWAVGHPTVDAFLELALEEAEEDQELRHMTWFISEMALFHREFVSVRPSVLARSALTLAQCILGRPQPRHSDWSSGYDAGTVLSLSNHLYNPSQILTKKYSSAHLSHVAITVDDFLQRHVQLARRATATPPIEMSVKEPVPVSNVYLAPQTPHKNHGPMVQHGCLTPPITPENEQFGNNNFGKEQRILPHLYPPTPTSQPSTQQMPQMQYHQQYYAPHFIQ